jgi:hypothetical protein
MSEVRKVRQAQRNSKEEHHGREYIIGALGALAEFLAVRYSIGWLAYLSSLFIWLAVIEYSRHSKKAHRYTFAIAIGSAVIIAIATYYFVNPASSEHTVLIFDAPQRVTDQPSMFPIRADEVPALNLGFYNGGDFHILDARWSFYMVVVPYDEVKTDKAFPKYYGQLRTAKADVIADAPPHPNPRQHFYLTFYGQKFGVSDVDGLTQSTSALYVVGAATWRDKSGSYETQFSQYLWREPSTGTFNWHLETDNQKEVKL